MTCIRALALFPCLIPCHRCEKSARESRHFHHFIRQLDRHPRESPRHLRGSARMYDVRMAQFVLKIAKLRPWQTRTHCCGHIQQCVLVCQGPHPRTCGLRPRLWLLKLVYEISVSYKKISTVSRKSHCHTETLQFPNRIWHAPFFI